MVDLRESVRVGKGFLVLLGLPLVPLLISRDINRELRYKNNPNNIGYNPLKPTPNTEDFPDGIGPGITDRYFSWASR